MHDTEERRRMLLDETRRLYSDSYDMPAVHPRYRASFRALYEDEPPVAHGTFGVRLLISILLLAAFLTLDREEETFLNFDSQRIVQEISTTWSLR